MKPPRLFSLELGRLLKSRLTWLVLLLTVLSPAAGLVLYRPAAASTMLSTYLANPALAGGVVGGVLFGLLAVYELDRTERGRVSPAGGRGGLSPDDGPGAPARSNGNSGTGTGPYCCSVVPGEPATHRLCL